MRPVIKKTLDSIHHLEVIIIITIRKTANDLIWFISVKKYM